MIHLLKINSRHYARLVSGQKLFEIRLNDRDFQVGDAIHFHLNNDDPDYMHGKFNPACDWRITYVHGGFGMQEGYVALSIVPYKQYDEYNPRKQLI
jgi:hypothetical protein